MKAAPTLFAALFVLAAISAAQSQVRPAAVEGTVKNLRTGEPVADARVTLTPEPPGAGTKTADTDAEGRFAITGIAPGRYAIAATRTLFFRPRRDAGAAVLALGEGQSLTGVQVLLAPTGVIAGRVIDESHAPLRSVRVEALRREYRNGVRTWVAAAQSTSDDRGAYRLFNLQPGTYYVRATQGTAIDSPVPLYYPGVSDVQAASSIDIDAGEEAAGLDIELRRIPRYSVRFKFGDMPVGGTSTFTVRRRNGSILELQVARPETRPDNTYRIVGLAPGTYDISASFFTPLAVQPRILTHAATFTVDLGNADRDLGTVALQPAVSVSGRLIVPEALPSALDLQRLVLMLRRPADLVPGAVFSVRGSTVPPGFNPDGSFTLPNVAVGRYQIELTGLPAGAQLVSVREGARDVTDIGVDVTGSQNALELVVGGPGSVGSVAGTVVNALGQPVPSSTVVLVPAPERRTNPAAFKSVTADQLGNFIIRSALPGDYRLLAWEDIEPGMYMDPEFLRGFETRGEVIRIQRGSQSAVSVRVVR